MENDDWFDYGHDIGLSGGAMPTYQDIRDHAGEAAANWAYDGYDAGSRYDSPQGSTSSSK